MKLFGMIGLTRSEFKLLEEAVAPYHIIESSNSHEKGERVHNFVSNGPHSLNLKQCGELREVLVAIKTQCHLDDMNWSAVRAAPEHPQPPGANDGGTPLFLDPVKASELIIESRRKQLATAKRALALVAKAELFFLQVDSLNKLTGFLQEQEEEEEE